MRFWQRTQNDRRRRPHVNLEKGRRAGARCALPLLLLMSGSAFAQAPGLRPDSGGGGSAPAAVPAVPAAQPAAAPAATPAPAPAPTPPPRSRVVLVERPSVVQRFSIDEGSIRGMFNEGLIKLTNQPSPAAAWQSLGIVPEDVVGIKIATAGGPVLSTHRVLIDAIAQGLQSAGVKPGNIIIWDKYQKELVAARYVPSNGSSYEPSVRSVIPDTGFDPAVYYVNEILGKLIWGDMQFQGTKRTLADLERAGQEAVERAARGSDAAAAVPPAGADQTSNKSFFAKLLTQTCTKVINVPVLASNNAIGLNACMSSLALGIVDNTRRFQNETGNFGDTAIPDILDRDLIRKKVILHVLDALIAQYAGGPNFEPLYSHSPGALYLSRDPVAIDALALARVEQWRAESRIVPLGAMGRYIKTADSYGIGQASRAKIDLITLP